MLILCLGSFFMQLLGKEVTLFGLDCAMHNEHVKRVPWDCGNNTHEILPHNKSHSLQLEHGQAKGGRIPWARLGSQQSLWHFDTGMILTWGCWLLTWRQDLRDPPPQRIARKPSRAAFKTHFVENSVKASDNSQLCLASSYKDMKTIRRSNFTACEYCRRRSTVYEDLV